MGAVGKETTYALETVIPLLGFGPREVAQPVILDLGVVVGAVVEGGG